jgi:hypothetical protein
MSESFSAAYVRAYVAALPEEERNTWPTMFWSPIDTAPRDNRAVLLWFPDGMPRDHVMIGSWQPGTDGHEGSWRFKNHSTWGTAVRGCPSHWMPLPGGPPTKDPVTS